MIILSMFNKNSYNIDQITLGEVDIADIWLDV